MMPTAKDLEWQPPALLDLTSPSQCYLVQRSSGSSACRPSNRSGRVWLSLQPFMTNQFLSRREQMIRNMEFCVPTTFGPGNG
jgi:hypothetical protein